MLTTTLLTPGQIPGLIPGLIPGSIPGPPGDGVWELGPVPIRGYALCIIAGIIAAIWIGEKRWQARGGRPGDIQDMAIWAVPFGLVGARAYHVATDWKQYFGEGGDPISALYVWQGGLGIWGAVALGVLGAWLWSRRRGVRFAPVLDSLAPGLLVAQALGRWGNWFNSELYGHPTSLPWGLEVDRSDWPVNCDWPSGSGTCLVGFPDTTLFHPTFLYECLWNLAVVAVILLVERRWRIGYGRVFAIYVMGYTLGRGWIEYLRIDDVQLENVLGLRFNVWTSIVLFLAALAFFLWSLRRHPGREDTIDLPGRADDEAGTADDETATAEDESAEPDDTGGISARKA